MVGLNMLFLTLLHVAQLALVIVVVVFAIRDIKKGSTHRVLMGSLIALVVLVVVTPVLGLATIKEGMREDREKEKEKDVSPRLDEQKNFFSGVSHWLADNQPAITRQIDTQI
jgi:type VI protein secretion system component VasK